MHGRSYMIDGVGSHNTNETLLFSTEQSSFFDLSETSIMITPFSPKDFSGFSNFYEKHPADNMIFSKRTALSDSNSLEKQKLEYPHFETVVDGNLQASETKGSTTDIPAIKKRKHFRHKRKRKKIWSRTTTTTKLTTLAPTATIKLTTLAPTTTKRLTTLASTTTTKLTTLAPTITTKRTTLAPTTTKKLTTLAPPTTTKWTTLAPPTTTKLTTLAPTTTTKLTTFAPTTTIKLTTLSPATEEVSTWAPTTTTKLNTLPSITEKVTTLASTTEEVSTMALNIGEETELKKITEELTFAPATEKPYSEALASTALDATLADTDENIDFKSLRNAEESKSILLPSSYWKFHEVTQPAFDLYTSNQWKNPIQTESYGSRENSFIEEYLTTLEYTNNHNWNDEIKNMQTETTILKLDSQFPTQNQVTDGQPESVTSEKYSEPIHSTFYVDSSDFKNSQNSGVMNSRSLAGLREAKNGKHKNSKSFQPASIYGMHIPYCSALLFG